MVQLYYCRIPNELNENLISGFSEYRQNKLQTITSEKARRQGICAELLLEKAVEGIYPKPLNIVVNENGKPYFSDRKLFFSISHSDEYIACAVYEKEIGLDIQTRVKYNPKLAQRFFKNDEILYIQHFKDCDRAFTEIWCKKESRLKALGHGLKGGLNSFSTLENPAQWISGDLDSVHYAVCIPGCNEFEIELREIKLL